jgi:hypothetical protein
MMFAHRVVRIAHEVHEDLQNLVLVDRYQRHLRILADYLDAVALQRPFVYLQRIIGEARDRDRLD